MVLGTGDMVLGVEAMVLGAWLSGAWYWVHGAQAMALRPLMLEAWLGIGSTSKARD